MRRPHPSPLIEPLESRIAPAAVVFTATNYTDIYKSPKTGQTLLQFFKTSDPTLSGTNLSIAQEIGQTTPVPVYFIKITSGEDVRIPTSVGFQDVVNVSKGTVVAVFTDMNNDGVVDSTELTGLALGTKTSVALGTGVSQYQVNNAGPYYGGFIVTDYNDSTGTLGGTSLLTNTVKSLTVAGPVQGGFISGGAVSKFTATGNVNEILTGYAANGTVIGFEGAANTTTLSVPVPGTGVAGPSISKVTIGSTTSYVKAGVGGIQLGQGGAGAAGGSVLGLTLLNDTTGFSVLAGAGGAGASSGKTTGGKGGSITGVVLNGPLSTAPDITPNDPIVLTAGAGGAGTGSSKGGAGGSVQNVFLDYNSASVSDPSLTTVLDNVTVTGGAGGAGGTGGAGGSLTNVNVITTTPHDTTLVNNLPVIELSLIGGVGGTFTVGKGGTGGSITKSQVIDDALFPAYTTLPDDTTATDPTSPTNVQILVQAGAGGGPSLSPVASKGVGGKGGSVNILTLKGFNLNVQSGAGGNGIGGGGAGGSVSTVNVLGSAGALPGDNFHAESLFVSTGGGGNGTQGKGGRGGALSGLTVQNSDFGGTHLDSTTLLQVPDGLDLLTGPGGTAGKGVGGAGGALSNVKITGIDFLTLSHPLGNSGLANIATGAGGNAAVAGGKGGAGGAMTSVTVVGTRLNAPNVSTGGGGTGGASGVAGKGGAGGKMSSVAIRTAEGLAPSVTTASTGLLLDQSQDFGPAGLNVQVGDQIQNTGTFVTATVTGITTDGVAPNDELTLTSDIFATGDKYLLPEMVFPATAGDSQNTIVDANANFGPTGLNIQQGTIVEDVTDTEANNGVPVTVKVISVTPTTLTVSGDISHVGDQYEFPSLGTAQFIAGAGGAGSLNGAGGAGGSILNSSGDTPGLVSFNAGNGGGGGISAKAGAGGGLTKDAALSDYASGTLHAGNAGATGSKGAAGGTITGADVQALTDVSIIAGNGNNGSTGGSGGAGGSIKGGGFSGVLINGGGFNPPSGNITVQAGTGGGSSVAPNTLPAKGGAGGSISTLTGFITTGDGVNSFITQFDAGAGGSGTGKGGAGGSVDKVRFFGGGGDLVTFFINAGDAGNATTGKTGAKGGSVTNIGGGAFASGSTDPNFAVNPLTDFHHISAGNGGNAVGKGGLGGSVSNVFVNAAIGLRTGAVFGFDVLGIPNAPGLAPATATGAGGISAGAGGTGSTAGKAGNVTGITADAIASIVAGHLHIGDGLQKTNLATKVDGIILNGNVQPSLVQEFNLTFNGDTTPSIATNATSAQVAFALNSLPTIISAGGVTVKSTANGYVVTFDLSGAQVALTSGEPALASNGTTTELVQGSATTSEEQNVQITGLNPFVLGFEGQNTGPLPQNATLAQVSNALNALPAIQNAGGVEVAAGTAANNPGYNITFFNTGFQTHISALYAPYTIEQTQGNATTSEVQAVQVLAPDPFTLSFGGQTTSQLAASDTAANVSTALNALSSIQAAGGVSVVQGPVMGVNPTYDITFTNPGAQTLIIPNFTLGVSAVTGTPTTPQVVTLTFPIRGDFAPPQFSSANFVGSIANILQPNAATFHFTPLVAGSGFQFGDAPIDGLIAALTLTSNKNFFPEAFVTAGTSGSAVLVDSLNS